MSMLFAVNFLAPTGKSFKLPMCTVGHWKNGVMDEEYLFWDNQTYMQRIGLAPWSETTRGRTETFT